MKLILTLTVTSTSASIFIFTSASILIFTSAFFGCRSLLDYQSFKKVVGGGDSLNFNLFLMPAADWCLWHGGRLP